MPTSLDDYDPFDPAVIADPFPYYRLLQSEAPVFEIAASGIFVLSRYDDVEAAAQNWEDFSTTWGPGPQCTKDRATRLRSVASTNPLRKSMAVRPRS